MFDGIDHVTLFGPDLEGLLRLYRDHLGFTETDRHEAAPGSDLHRLWRLPDTPLDVRSLAKPGASGGSMRLVGVPGLRADDTPRSMARPGPFAIDFYVRDLPGLHARLADAGYGFRSAPVRYPLFGAGFEVDEVLLEAPLGLVHAFVEYLPGRHRCVLGQDDDASVSEVVAAITVVDDVEEGLGTLRDALGGQVYFDEVFQGPDVEHLIGLPEGSAFRAVLLRGRERRNARAELMQTVPRAAPDARADGLHPGVVLSVGVDDVGEVLAGLPAGAEVVGPLRPDGGPHDGRIVATVWTRWGAVLELVSRGSTATPQ